MDTKTPDDPSTTVTDLDADTLAEAQRMFDAATQTDTVNRALREVVRRRLADDYVAFLQQRGAMDVDARERAWQRSST